MTPQFRFSSGVSAFTACCFALALALACGDTRVRPGEEGTFGDGADAAAGDCHEECSIDGRAKQTVCDGVVTNSTPCPAELACGGAQCLELCAAAAADRSSNGCEFYIQPARFGTRYQQMCYAAYVVNTADRDATISIEYQGEALDISKSMFRTTPGSEELTAHTGPLPPGEGAIVFISDRDRKGEPWMPISAMNPDIPCPHGVVPATHADIIGSGTGVGASFHVTANVPVSLASIYPFGGAASFMPSATLHLPVPTWALQHVIVNGWEGGPLGGPTSVIVASEDDTEVTLVPRVDLQDGIGVQGVPAETPVTFHLDKGQNLRFVQSRELTGSMVTSTKPTTMYGGNDCAYIPTTEGACDTLNQQIPALEQWGSEYVAVGHKPRLGNEHEAAAYRIVAARDGTLLDYDPPHPPAGAPTSLSRGESVTFFTGTGDAFVVRTQDEDHPIYVGTYMIGGDTTGGSGDPDFVNVVPPKQYRNSYSFFADPTFPETSLVIVRAKRDGRFYDVELDCAGKLTTFKPIGTRGQYEFTRVDLSRGGADGETFEAGTCRVGTQRMRSEGPFAATLWGWGVYASYAYTSGTSLRKLVTNPITVF
ncbi:MAG: hypothetical protein K0S65_1486 [Labilithrix sp.]|nr:hypothetical protein [Labilithrix sp.]